MGKKTNNYKNLQLDLGEIPNIINAWGMASGYQNVSVEIPRDMGVQTLNYLVNCDGKVATLAVFPTVGGTCTISPKFGKEQVISADIAEYIVSHSGKLAESNPYKNGLSIDISKEEFGAFFDLLKEQEDVEIDELRESDDFFARLRSKRYKDTIVIWYYRTGKLVIQGRPLELFSKAVEILSCDHGLTKVVNAEVRSAGLKMNGSDILDDMKKSLGATFDFLTTAQKTMLCSSYIFYRTEIEIEGDEIQMDFSVLFFSASRALEGYILKLLVNNNVLHENGENVGYYFRGEDASNPLTLHSQYEADIDNDIITCEINRLYKLYHKLRHPYAHSTENNFTTAIISEREIADSYFKEIIEMISNSYEVITLAKK